MYISRAHRAIKYYIHHNIMLQLFNFNVVNTNLTLKILIIKHVNVLWGALKCHTPPTIVLQKLN